MIRLDPAPKLKLGTSRSGKRSRYWATHSLPERKMTKTPGYAKRLRREDGSILQRVADLGNASDVAVIQHKAEDLKQDRAFGQHQQKLWSAIDRFKAHGAYQEYPRRVLTTLYKTAFNTKGKEVKDA